MAIKNTTDENLKAEVIQELENSDNPNAAAVLKIIRSSGPGGVLVSK